MVLLNGIKYACERCIRGHRVSACSHTDKPLMMIKPKGRPASQCPHCREQRKVKNSHTSCNCGKKGKSPGQHLASCSCHKNSHCTCVTKEKKPTAKKRGSPDLAASDSGDASQSEASHGEPRPTVSTQDSDFLIEDIAIPFETDSGLLDYFQPSKVQDTPEEQYAANGQFAPQLEFASGQIQHTQSTDTQESYFPEGNRNGREMAYFPHPPSDADLDLMENMFPLFPLVGFNSFEDDKSLPLSGLPGQNHSMPSSDTRASRNNAGVPSTYATLHKTEGPHSAVSRRSGSAQPASSVHSNSAHSNLHSGNPSSISLTNMHVAPTHHPRPLKPSSSFSVGYQNNRPRRSESVMSAASTSSNTSKQNLFESSQANQHHFPKTPSSAAFPPFNLSDNNSTDDFHQMNFNSPGFFNENRSLPILSDEEVSRCGQLSGNVTPQSSIPSRQLSQTRRKTSLSRSHSQLHHNTVSKEHALFPVKAGSSSDNSPRQLLERKFASYDETMQKNELDSYLREVAEETSGHLQNDDSGRIQPPRADAGFAPPTQGDEFNIDNPDFSMIPMYQELFEPMQNGI